MFSTNDSNTDESLPFGVLSPRPFPGPLRLNALPTDRLAPPAAGKHTTTYHMIQGVG